MKLEAQKRPEGKANALRQNGYIPGIIYNKEINVPVAVEMRAFDKAFRAQGLGNLIEIDLEGETHNVLVKGVQMNKRRREPQHVDFYAVTAGQPVEVGVHLEFTGTPVGVKEGGLLDIQRREIRISILPRLIPAGVEVDVTDLQMGSSLHISDIVKLLPEGTKIVDDESLTVAAVVAPRVIEETVEAETVQPELIGREGSEAEEAISGESEAPVEGAE